jgi:hypothetical protein
MQSIFEYHHCAISEQSFLAVIQWEQSGYLKPMEVPDGTAHNSALLENVFVTLVCILNKIPVFIVGKPGTSALSTKLLELVLTNL